MALERGSDLRHVECAGPGVEEPDPGKDRVRANAVGDREVDGALDGASFLDLVRGQRVGHGPHQLEEHSQVEQVARQREARHRAQEDEHQRVEQAIRPVEVVP